MQIFFKTLVPAEVHGLTSGVVYGSTEVKWSSRFTVFDAPRDGRIIVSAEIEEQDIVIHLDPSINDHYENLPENINFKIENPEIEKHREQEAPRSVLVDTSLKELIVDIKNGWSSAIFNIST